MALLGRDQQEVEIDDRRAQPVLLQQQNGRVERHVDALGAIMDARAPVDMGDAHRRRHVGATDARAQLTRWRHAFSSPAAAARRRRISARR
jgi:hypothetical protein